ncbi:Med5-domain-containing protein [Microthyrium microscopicum]|uniref:Mediator of RNA polymerase II transcription subunit 5 n=1 Tax=Microthyrium microscopicum TaxID=703497 RepID=A0A6A6UN54_9PEZI|nr:Med5-domain-containing protein [Microthyrium microscopicum]
MTTQSSTHVIHVPTKKIKPMKENAVAEPSVWKLLFHQCLHERIQGPKFRTLAGQLWAEKPSGRLYLANELLDCQRTGSIVSDSLFTEYFEDLLLTKRISVSDVLDATLEHSLYRQHKPPREPKNSSDLQTALVMLVTRQILTHQAPKHSHLAQKLLQSVLGWLQAIVKSDQLLLDENGPQLCDALGFLAAAALENGEMISMIDNHSSKSILKPLSETLHSFYQLWTQTGSQVAAQHANRLLEAIRLRPKLRDESETIDEKSTNLAQATLQISQVVDVPTIPTRPAMFIFLESLVFARPIPDDLQAMGFLHIKYKLNMQVDSESLFIDLVVGAFDLLSSAVTRKESEETTFALKSFLVNKLPQFLTNLAQSMFSADRPENCFAQALSRINHAMFPSPSFGMVSEHALQDVRQEFLFSCALHSLLRPSSIQALLGEQPISQPPDPSSRYLKETLIEQCASDSDRISQLIDELDKLNGNAGPISFALFDVIRTLCMNKDTFTLKSICNSLTAKPKLLDVMAQFVPLVALLQPICQLLDDWRYEDDQGEYQPVYEEFASVFLLVLSVVYRFDIAVNELGIPSDSFVSKYLENGHKIKAVDSLTDDEKKHLSVWMKGLFNPDSITDEVLSSCQPQQFYLLSATICYNILSAVVQKMIPFEATKTAFEYLCEPFLVPSLIGSMNWMLRHSWKNRRNPPEMGITLRFIFRAIKPPTEPVPVYKTVIRMMAEPTVRTIERICANSPQFRKAAVIEQMLIALNSIGSFKRTNYDPDSDLSSQLRHIGNLRPALKTAFQALIAWGSSSPMNPSLDVPNYSPRLFYSALAADGAGSVLSTILDEIQAQSISPSGAPAIALDIATAWICAPVPGSRLDPTDWAHTSLSDVNRGMNLRETLGKRYDQLPQKLDTNMAYTEAVVRLYRRVENQLAISVNNDLNELAAQQIMTGLGAMASEEVATVAAAEIDVAAGAGAGVGAGMGDAMDFTNTGAAGGMDLSGDAMDMSMQMDGGMDLGSFGGGIGGDDDIFAGLDVDEIDFTSFG